MPQKFSKSATEFQKVKYFKEKKCPFKTKINLNYI